MSPFGVRLRILFGYVKTASLQIEFAHIHHCRNLLSCFDQHLAEAAGSGAIQ